jgi:hypothetical protein
MARTELRALVARTIANIRREYLTRREMARRIRVIRRLVRWGRR